MLNSAMPKMPGMGSMTETFEFVKNLWGGAGKQSMGIPGMVMPTMSVEEVDKQIKDLKAVESWLTVNMNMLRGTIQALEVQSATITALQTMGQNFSAAVASAGGDKAAPNFTFAQQTGAADAAAATAAAASAAADAERTEERRKVREALKEEFKASGDPAKPAEPEAAANASPAGNPSHWWNLLQDQFKQAVSTAMAPETMSSMSNMGSAAKSAMESVAKSMTDTVMKPVKKAAAKPAAKPAAKAVKKTAAKTVTKAAAKPAAKKTTKRKLAPKA